MTTAIPPQCLVMVKNKCNFCDNCNDIQKYTADWSFGWMYCVNCKTNMENSLHHNYKIEKSFDIRKFKDLYPEIDLDLLYSVPRRNGNIDDNWSLGNQCYRAIVKLYKKASGEPGILIWLTRKSTLSIKGIYLEDFYKHNMDKLEQLPIDDFKKRALKVLL